MALNMRPWLDQRPPYGSRRKIPRIADILAIAVAVAIVGFLAVLLTAIVTGSGG
jgi:hypothetical protein